MILKYGGYAHQPDEAAVRIVLTPLYNSRGQQVAVRHHWFVDGLLQAGSAAALTSAINALQAAYAENGHDLGLYLADGVTLSAHRLVSEDALGGTRVLELSFPRGDGIEYATVRSYRLRIEAEFIDTSIGLIDYQEQVRFSGGGAREIYQPILNGNPQRQQTHQETTYRARQTGFAIGTQAYPTPASPIWPTFEHRERRAIELHAPRIVSGRQTDYRVSWSYEFESNDPLLGQPALV